MTEAIAAPFRSLSKFVMALIALSATGTIGLSALAFHSRPPAALTRYALGIALAMSLAGRTREGRLRCAYKPAFEFDAFVFFAWPAVLPYYLFHTRGWRGLRVTAGFFGLAFAPYFTEAMIQAWMSLR